VQLYESEPSLHVPPFWHGEDTHSLTLTSQLKPANPRAHTHVYLLTWSKHVPLLRHGADEHSSSSVKQEPTGVSVKPDAHVQVYELMPCEHVPPFLHGDDAHSFTLTSQIAPEKPALHVHRYWFRLAWLLLESLQTPWFLQGDDLHSLTSPAQLLPL